MHTHTQDSVMTALADVIDLQKARAAREADALQAKLEAERAEREAREQQEREDRERAAHLAQLEEARREREASQARQQAVREARLQERLAERTDRIQAETDAEIARLRLAHEARHRRFRRWVVPTVLSMLLVLLGAVGCLVGSAVHPSNHATPVVSTAAAGGQWLDDAQHAAARHDERTRFQAELAALPQPTAHDANAHEVLPRALAPKVRTWVRRPVPTSTTTNSTTTTKLCSEMGVLGCLND